MKQKYGILLSAILFLSISSGISQPKTSNLKAIEETFPNFIYGDENDFVINNNDVSIINSSSSTKTLISDHYIESNEGIVFESYLSIANNSHGGLIFGIKDKDEPTKNGCYTLLYDGNNFTLDSHLYGNVAIGNYSQAFENQNNIKLKVELTYSCQIKCYANDTLIFDVFDYDYHGGYFGVYSQNGEMHLDDINVHYNTANANVSDISVSNTNLIYLPTLYGYDIVIKEPRNVNVNVTGKTGQTIKIDGIETSNKSIFVDENKKVIIESTQDEKSTRYIINLRIGYNDSYRPTFHKSMEKGFVNDPNGLVYDKKNDTYHMFYQFNKALNSDANGNKNVIGKDGSTGAFTRSWAHSISKDLVKWMDMPVAIYPYNDGDIFSGSCVIDENNTSGLFDGCDEDSSRLVAVYTWYGPNWKHPINASYSTDFGVTFKTKGVIFDGPNETFGDYRDPKVFWFEDETLEKKGTWMMVFGGWTQINILTSPNLLNWTPNSKVNGYDGQEFLGECPDMLKLSIDGKTKYVLTLAGEYYIVGDIIKNKVGKYEFIPETYQTLLYNNPIIANTSWNKGCQYAGVSFNNEKYGRVVMVNWIVDYLSDYVDDKCWNGFYTIPCEVKLEKINGMYALSKYPISEINSLHDDKLLELNNFELSSSSDNPLASIEQKTLDIDFTFTLKGQSKVTLRIEKDSNNYYQVVYDSKNALMSIEYASNGISCPWDDFNSKGKMKASLLPNNNQISIRVLLDILGIDAYGNNGIQTFYSYLWDNNPKRISLKVEGESITINNLSIYKMGGNM